MDSRSKVYHIYAKEECLYNNLTEQQFSETWNTLKGMVGLMQTDYQLEDLTYEEVYGLPTNTEHSCQSRSFIDLLHNNCYN